MQSSNSSTPDSSAFTPPRVPPVPTAPVPLLPYQGLIPQARQAAPVSPLTALGRVGTNVAKPVELPKPAAEPKITGLQRTDAAMKTFADGLTKATKAAESFATAIQSSTQKATAAAARATGGGGGGGGAGAGGAGGGGGGGGGNILARAASLVPRIGADAAATDLYSFLSGIRGQAERFKGLSVISSFEGLMSSVERPALAVGALSGRSSTNITRLLQSFGGGEASLGRNTFAELGIGPAEQLQMVEQIAKSAGGVKEADAARAARMVGAGENVGAYFGRVGRLRGAGVTAAQARTMAGTVQALALGAGYRGDVGSAVQEQLTSAFMTQREADIGELRDPRKFFSQLLNLGGGSVQRGVQSFQRGQGITRGAEQGLLAPYSGLAENAVSLYALRQAKGDQIEAARLVEELQLEGPQRIREIVTAQLGERTGYGALRAAGFTVAQLQRFDTQDQVRRLGELPEVERLGAAPRFATSRAMFEATQVQRMEEPRRREQFRISTEADSKVVEAQLQRFDARFTGADLQAEINKSIDATKAMSGILDDVNELIGTKLADSIKSLAANFSTLNQQMSVTSSAGVMARLESLANIVRDSISSGVMGKLLETAGALGGNK